LAWGNSPVLQEFAASWRIPVDVCNYVQHKPLCVGPIRFAFQVRSPFRREERIMTVQEFQARKTERIAIAVSHYVATTPVDKLDWCPSTGEESCTRSVLDQASECVACNRMVAGLLGCEDCPESVKVTDAVTAKSELMK